VVAVSLEEKAVAAAAGPARVRAAECVKAIHLQI